MKGIQVNDFCKNRIVGHLKTNISETCCAYFEDIYQLEDNTTHRKIALLHIETSTITYPVLDIEPYDFFFKDDLLILKVNKGEQSHLYSYDIKSETLREIITFPFELKETYLGETDIYFAADVQKNNDKSCIRCSQKGPFYQEGLGVRGERVTGLFKSSYDGKDIKLITSLDMNVDQVDFDGDHKRIVFTVFRAERLKPVDSDVYTYDMKDETLTKFTDGNYRIGFIQSMTEDTLLFTGVDMREKSRNDNQQIYKVNSSTAQYERLGDFIDMSNEVNAVITDSTTALPKPICKYEDHFYHIRVDRKRDVLYKTSPDGVHTPIETGLKKIDGYRILKKGILICGLKDMALSELYWLQDGELKQVTHNNKWLDAYTISPCDEFVLDSQGVEIDGYVFKPIDFDENKKYPGVLFIHGGPKMIFSSVFMHDVQVLCANGYFVYFTNPIGSDGRGEVFSDIRGNMLDRPYMQLMDLTDAVLSRYPQMNPNALGVTGGSYGGLMTNHIITQTKRFKAAVSERGISSMMTSFTSSDIGYKFSYEYMGNKDTPWQDPSIYLKHSPIMEAHKATTPTLFIHGKDDYRCHYSESLNMYGALNYHGIESKFCLFEGENHGLAVRGKPQSKQRRYTELLGWFNYYLKEETEDGIR